MWRIARGDRNGGVGAQQLSDPARVDHDIVTDLDAPFRDQGDEVRLVGGLRIVWGVEKHEQFAGRLEIVSEHVDLAGKKIGAGAGHDEHRCVLGHLAGLGEYHAIDHEVVQAKRLAYPVVAVAVLSVRRPLAVSLDEIHALLLALDHLDQCVRELLFFIAHDPLDTVLVFDHDRAVGLDLVLTGGDRVPVDVDELE